MKQQKPGMIVRKSISELPCSRCKEKKILADALKAAMQEIRRLNDELRNARRE